MSDDRRLPPVFDDERLTDMEVAMKLSLLMESDCRFGGSHDRLNGENMYTGLAEDAMRRMTNPFAKRFLESTIAKRHENTLAP